MTAQRGRPKKLEDAVVLYVRAPASLVEQLDAWLANLRDENPGMGGITRADLIRNLLMRAVEEHERSVTASAKPARATAATVKPAPTAPNPARTPERLQRRAQPAASKARKPG